MKDLIKKNWIYMLGMSFLFTGTLYFFKVAIDHGWLPPALRAVIGLTAGVSALFAGYLSYGKGKRNFSELISGGGLGGIVCHYCLHQF